MFSPDIFKPHRLLLHILNQTFTDSVIILSFPTTFSLPLLPNLITKSLFTKAGKTDKINIVYKQFFRVNVPASTHIASDSVEGRRGVIRDNIRCRARGVGRTGVETLGKWRNSHADVLGWWRGSLAENRAEAVAAEPTSQCCGERWVGLYLNYSCRTNNLVLALLIFD